MSDIKLKGCLGSIRAGEIGYTDGVAVGVRSKPQGEDERERYKSAPLG